MIFLGVIYRGNDLFWGPCLITKRGLAFVTPLLMGGEGTNDDSCSVPTFAHRNQSFPVFSTLQRW